MSIQSRGILVIGAGIIVGLVLLACVVLFIGGLGVRQMGGAFGFFPDRFDSNGERIYFTATSNSGQPITAEMAGMRMRRPEMS